MNNIFTLHEDAVLTRIVTLRKQANELIQQRKQVKRDKVLKDGYTIAISNILDSIIRLSDQIAKK